MSWSIGYDTNFRRDVGYGVPASCDHPGCGKEIDRGLSYICGGDIGGGEHGCGLFFCEAHLSYNSRRDSNGEISVVQLCERCAARSKRGSFEATPDIEIWVRHKLTDPSWAEWRETHPDEVKLMEQRLAQGITVLSPFDEDACMRYNPFEGEFGDGEKVLRDRMVTCRKETTCLSCGQPTKLNTRVRARTEVYDGKIMTFHWCALCCAAAAASWTDEGRSLEARASLHPNRRDL